MGAALLLKRITLIGLLWYILGDYHARVFSWIKRTDQPWSKTLFLMLLSIKAAELSRPMLRDSHHKEGKFSISNKGKNHLNCVWNLFFQKNVCVLSFHYTSNHSWNSYISFVKFMMKTWRFEELLFTTNSKITVNYSKQSCTFFLFAGGSKSDYSPSSFF